MVPLGLVATFMAVARGTILGPFAALDVLHIAGFAVLTSAVLGLRRQAGWHKRLARCGTILLDAPTRGLASPRLRDAYVGRGRHHDQTEASIHAAQNALRVAKVVVENAGMIQSAPGLAQ